MYQLKELPKTGWCCYCKVYKPASDFYMRRKDSFALMSCCKKCQNERALINRKLRYERNPDYLKRNIEAVKEWAIRNPDRAKVVNIACGQRHQQRQSKLLTDKYIAKNYFSRSSLRAIPLELIAVKKEHVKIHRELKRIKNAKRN